MARFLKKRSTKAGSAPGMLVYSGDKRTGKVDISVMDYNESKANEETTETVSTILAYRDQPTTTWINVNGLHKVPVIQELGEHYGLHPLVMEDILNTGQRPKLEENADNLFIVMKMFKVPEPSGQIETEQISIILGKDFVISFQEMAGDLFDPVRERIRSGKGRIRKLGAAYLAYALIDAIVDGYYVVLENLGERIEAIEESLVEDPHPGSLQTIYGLKREMIFLRKSVWPLREVVNNLERGESPLINKACRVFFRDVYDHTIQVIDSVETYRDLLSGLQDLYLSSISNKMNEVMKVLTIIATIFIPLTFIAGIYGMNFDPGVSDYNMPELGLRYGYIGVWVIMLMVGAAMVYMFRRLKWL